jgi:hypothetical protein
MITILGAATFTSARQHSLSLNPNTAEPVARLDSLRVATLAVPVPNLAWEVFTSDTKDLRDSTAQ